MKERRAQSGVALVITLIMLSVITLIAVAFLALSQRERASVSSSISATEDELMANAGLERAKAQILAAMAAFMANPTNRAFTNAANEWVPRLTLGPDLLVSITDTNYTNAPYLTPGVTPGDRNAIADLLEDPRVPVFVKDRTGATNFVFYLDLNRNGKFEPSGFVPLFEDPTQLHYAIGDPEWVGVLSRINAVHSGTNRFVGRYAYIILPVGRTTDIDAIHNDAKGGGFGQFFRNQGHGSWELNLAAFLADLNTNYVQYGWGDYRYNTSLNGISGGAAFDNASAILNFRYAGTPLRSPQDVFGFTGDLFAGDGIDQYANGSDSVPRNWATEPWAGAPNPQHFFTVHDFFNLKDPALYGTFQNFQGRLRNAGVMANDSYNRHTLYRMLAQLGTDTAPEKPRYRTGLPNNRVDNAPINLNYANTNDVDAADFVPWTAEGFFHTVADRLLRDHGFAIDANTPLSVTNLPVYPINHYRPEVHRVLQMALNVFDATTNFGAAYPFYPTALRPIFANRNNGDEVYIVGYTNVPQNYWAITNGMNWRDLSNATDRVKLGAGPNQFVYGVPILVGAKKGFPNFNEYVFQSVVQVHRELNIEKLQGRPATTNHVFYMGISNYMGFEAWNSYTNPYPRDLTMIAGVELTTSLTNEDGFVRISTNGLFETTSGVIMPANTWSGGEFLVPRFPPRQIEPIALEHFLPYWIYDANARQFSPSTNSIDRGFFPAPQWVLTTTNRVRFFLFDNGYLVDAVGLAPSVTTMNITKALHDMGDPQNPPLVGGTPLQNVFWLTNRVGGNDRNNRDLTRGMRNQILSSRTGQPVWNQRGTFRTSRQWPTVQEAARGFDQFLRAIENNSLTNAANTNMWAPFVPQQKVFQQFVWQANDPLVHHLVEDLRFATNTPPEYSTVNTPTFAVTSIGRLNPAYKPWGGNTNQDQSDPGRSTASYDGRVKDPLVRGSDDWSFPSNKFASIGTLGQVHRGTPWQTIYLKAPPADDAAWAKNHRGGRRSNPTNDWRLADIFTVAPHPNASRGRMSVNQTNLAGWSAVLSGIQIPILVERSGAITSTNIVVEPTAIEPYPVGELVRAINERREQLPGQVFTSVSEFLSTTNLTVGSPYLTPPYMDPNVFGLRESYLTDADYEAIPQRILSLVKPGEPRFVVYVFGQSLKPAPQSVIAGGPLRGLCVNYEVNGEIAARAVMRVDLLPVPPPNPVPAGGYLPVRPQVVIESFNLLPPD